MVTFMTYLTQFFMCYSICIFIFAPKLYKQEVDPEKKRLHKEVLVFCLAFWIYVISYLLIAITIITYEN